MRFLSDENEDGVGARVQQAVHADEREIADGRGCTPVAMASRAP
jgi:hypothetical protein